MRERLQHIRMDREACSRRYWTVLEDFVEENDVMSWLHGALDGHVRLGVVGVETPVAGFGDVVIDHGIHGPVSFESFTSVPRTV